MLVMVHLQKQEHTTHGNGSGGIWDVTFTNNVSPLLQAIHIFNQQATQTVGQGTGAIWNFTATNGSYSVTIDPKLTV